MAKTSRALAAFVLTFRFLSFAQTAPDQSSLSLLVNVLDRNGSAVQDLTKDNFLIKVNGHRAVVVDAHYSFAPRRVVVLLDISGSMAGQPETSKKWQVAREALEDFLADTPADVQVALLTFSSQVRDQFDFSQTRTSITTWLKDESVRQTSVKTGGGTALYDAMLAATKLFGSTRPGDAVYAITDGGDNSSHISETELDKLMLRSGIRLFLFLLDDPVPADLDLLGRGTITDLARSTGGFVFGVSGRPIGMLSLPTRDALYDFDKRAQDRIKLYTQALNVQVNGFYSVRWNSPLPTRKVNKLSLQVMDDSGRVKKDTSWTYQRSYFASEK
jgi:hypothetical protein